MIVFEFDEEKSLSNLEKHGIDFHSAQELWKDPDIVEIQAKSNVNAEQSIMERVLRDMLHYYIPTTTFIASFARPLMLMGTGNIGYSAVIVSRIMIITR